MGIKINDERPREWNTTTSFSIPLRVEMCEFTTMEIFKMIYSRFPVEPSDHIAYHKILFKILEANIIPSNGNYFGNDMYWGFDLIRNNIVEKEAMERYVANEVIKSLTNRYIDKTDIVEEYLKNDIKVTEDGLEKQEPTQEAKTEGEE